MAKGRGSDEQKVFINASTVKYRWQRGKGRCHVMPAGVGGAGGPRGCVRRGRFWPSTRRKRRRSLPGNCSLMCHLPHLSWGGGAASGIILGLEGGWCPRSILGTKIICTPSRKNHAAGGDPQGPWGGSTTPHRVKIEKKSLDGVAWSNTIPYNYLPTPVHSSKKPITFYWE